MERICQWGETKESKKTNKYLDLAWELWKLWNIKVIVIPVVVGALGTVLNGLERRLEESEIRRKIKTIQTITLLRSARILKRVMETWGNLQSLRLQWKQKQVGKSRNKSNNNNYNNFSLVTLLSVLLLKEYSVASVTGAQILNNPCVCYSHNILPMIKFQIET